MRFLLFLLALWVTPSHADSLLPPTPEGWRYERIELPLEFAPEIDGKGFEELRFSPGAFDPAAEDHFTYVFALWFDGGAKINRRFLHDFLTKYYNGLCSAVAESRGLELDLSQIAVSVKRAKRGGDKLQQYTATVHMFDVFNTGAALDLKMDIAVDEDRFLSLVSPQQRTHPIWTHLAKVRAAFPLD